MAPELPRKEVEVRPNKNTYNVKSIWPTNATDGFGTSLDKIKDQVN